MLSKKVRLPVFNLIGIALFIAAIEIVAATTTSTSIFSGYVIENSKYTASNGDEFVLSYIASEDKVVVDIGGKAIIVENNSCSTNSYMEACFNGGRFKGYNYSLPNRVVYEYSITLGILVPKVSISKSIDKAFLEVGQEAEVHVNITNSGSTPALVRFSESIPSGIKLVEIPGQPCQLSGTSSLVMTESMKPGDVKRCKYKARALMPGTFAMESKAEFESTKAEAVKSSASLTVLQPVVSIYAGIPGGIPLGERLNVTVKASSKDAVDFFVFSAFIPSRLKPSLVSKSLNAEKNKEGLAITYGDAFTSLNGTVGLVVALEAASVGTSIIAANATWVHNGTPQSVLVDFPVNVTLAKPYLRLAKYDSATKVAYADVVNPSHIDIFNVTSAFGSGQTKTTGTLGSLSHFSFQLQDEQPGNITASITYYTGYGQKLSSESTIELGNGSMVDNAEPNEPAPVPEAASQSASAETLEEVPKKSERQRSAMEAGMKRAFIVAGIIISAIIIFFSIKTKKASEESY